MDQLWLLVSDKCTGNQWEQLRIMVFCSVKVHKKEPILLKFVLKEKYLFYLFKTLLDLWLERNTNMKEQQNMVQKWSMQCLPLEFPKLLALSGPLMELVIMVCVDGPTIPECYICGPMPRLQLWEDNKQQECSPRSRLHSLKDRENLLVRKMRPE